MLSEALNLAKETIKEVHIRVKLYQRRSKKRYNNQVKSRNFQVDDLALRKYGQARKDAKEEKKWLQTGKAPSELLSHSKIELFYQSTYPTR